MIKRRRFLQYAGLGGVSLMSGLRARADAVATPTVAMRGDLETFEFETITIDRKGREKFRHQRTVRLFRENLGREVALSMIVIPGGAFLAGGAKPTKSTLQSTNMSHRVSVPDFFMGQHPVRQAEWEQVARLPRVRRDLHPNPACFQASELPVESVSWLDAVEFCARLSAHTGRLYGLPGESQWEYACRAGTTTPFHCGHTVTSQQANYVGTYTYAAEEQGHYRRATTPVENFAPNAFGLYDMHGNVWEWSADRWLETGALSKGGAGGNQQDWRALRGGSWSDSPVNIQTTTRTGNAVDALNRLLGFRVCCAV